MLPFHWRFGPFAISPVELFVFGGFGLVVWLAGRVMRRDHRMSGEQILDFALGALIGGTIGARLYYAVPLWIRGIMKTGEIVGSWSDGSGFYGAFLGGTLGILITGRIKALPAGIVVDATSRYLPLGFGIGKIGCFLAGCCYGVRTDGFLGVAFRQGSLCHQTHLKTGLIRKDALHSLPVHPAQIYELLLGLGLFAALTFLARRPRRTGELWCAYGIGYSLWRFTVEFFRDDPGRDTFGSGALSDSQITALVVAAGAAVFWGWLRRRPTVKPPEKPN